MKRMMIFLVTCLAPAAYSQQAADTYPVEEEGLVGGGFVAPAYTSSSDVQYPQEGEIIFETNGSAGNGTFKGYVGGGAPWVSFGGSAGNATATTPGLTTSFAPLVQSNFNSVSANYTVTDSDGYSTIFVSTAGSDRTITLPTAADNDGRVLTIKKTDSAAGTVTIDGENSDTIDGTVTKVLAGKNEFIQIQCDGGNWHIIGRGDGGTRTVSFTGTWSTNTSYTATETRHGAWATYEVKVAVSGAPTSAILELTLPSNRTIDTSIMTDAASTGTVVGRGFIVDSGTRSYEAVAVYKTTTSIRVAYLADNTTGITNDVAVTASAPMTWTTGDYLVVRFSVPISEWAL